MDILFFHSKRAQTIVSDKITLYHDSTTGNQDPYVWNKNFLYSFCKMHSISYTQRKPGDTIYFIEVTGGKDDRQYKCDLVFQIKYIYTCEEDKNILYKNKDLPFIYVNQPFIENHVYYNHYYWATFEHLKPTKRSHRRLIFLADEDNSFQPQNGEGELLDITKSVNNILANKGITSIRRKDSEGKLTEFITITLNDGEIYKLNNNNPLFKNPKVIYTGEDFEKYRKDIEKQDDFIDVLDYEVGRQEIFSLLETSEFKRRPLFLLNLDNPNPNNSKQKNRVSEFDYLILSIENPETLTERNIKALNGITYSNKYFNKKLSKDILIENRISLQDLNKVIISKKDTGNIAFINFSRKYIIDKT